MQVFGLGFGPISSRGPMILSLKKLSFLRGSTSYKSFSSSSSSPYCHSLPSLFEKSFIFSCLSFVSWFLFFVVMNPNIFIPAISPKCIQPLCHQSQKLLGTIWSRRTFLFMLLRISMSLFWSTSSDLFFHKLFSFDSLLILFIVSSSSFGKPGLSPFTLTFIVSFLAQSLCAPSSEWNYS